MTRMHQARVLARDRRADACAPVGTVAEAASTADLVEQIIRAAERDVGCARLYCAGLYTDSETACIGDGGMHVTDVPEHVIAALAIVWVRDLAARDRRDAEIRARRESIRLVGGAR